ncbi:tyrosine-type recombinase/integrase [[Clostridium] polysaccharolyticum]|uniref:Site-specific recombinase XerD n=1 Tax=[Clostridium] polysaccharolyticum TaxID=29364 RepID=A0A1H9YA45_9FIRM|nr:site-specific integrase [[Clostridium] polysaccharolyticum]SES65719.1 Site-specific recombinase XerD [[Clostridium] polysaccharolyticum]
MAVDLNGKKLPQGITQKKNGVYEGAFKYNGERYTVSSKKLSICKKKLEDKKYEVKHGKNSDNSSMKVNDWFEFWFEHYKKPQVKLGSATLYLNTYNTHIKKEIGKLSISKVKGTTIQSIYNKMDKAGYARNTLEVVRAILNGMFEQAFKDDLISSNPLAKTIMPKAKKTKKKKVPTREQQQVFITCAQKSELYNLIVVALYTGMRSGEIRALRWSDIDFNNKMICVNHTLCYKKGGEYYLGEPKTETSERMIPLLDGAAEAFENARKKQLEQKELLGSYWKPYPGLEDLIFTSPSGYPINNSMVCNKMKTIVRQIRKKYPDFPNITFHTLRHIFATRNIESKMQPQILKTILGHRKLATTMDLYAHVLDEEKTNAMQEVESKLDSVSKPLEYIPDKVRKWNRNDLRQINVSADTFELSDESKRLLDSPIAFTRKNRLKEFGIDYDINIFGYPLRKYLCYQYASDVEDLIIVFFRKYKKDVGIDKYIISMIREGIMRADSCRNIWAFNDVMKDVIVEYCVKYKRMKSTDQVQTKTSENARTP